MPHRFSSLFIVNILSTYSISLPDLVDVVSLAL